MELLRKDSKAKTIAEISLTKYYKSNCYLTSYRGMDVISKNIVVKKLRNETSGQAERRVRKEVIYETCMIKKLSVHPGIPLVLGICSESAPFRIIIQFRGDQSQFTSLMVHQALSNNTITDRAIWIKIVHNL